jgi:hypothetical protein
MQICHWLFIFHEIGLHPILKGEFCMLMWGTVVALSLSLLAVGPLRGSSPSWLLSGAELVAVISLFALVCLLESSGNNTDRSNPAS